MHNLCSGVPPKNKKTIVRKKNASDQGAEASKSSAEKKKSAEVRYTICVVEFRRRTKTVKKTNATDQGAQAPKSSAEKKKNQQISGRLMPHNRPQRKKGPQSL